MIRVAKFVAGFVAGVGVALVGLAWVLGPCPECQGSGYDEHDRFARCGLCEGTGW